MEKNLRERDHKFYNQNIFHTTTFLDEQGYVIVGNTKVKNICLHGHDLTLIVGSLYLESDLHTLGGNLVIFEGSLFSNGFNLFTEGGDIEVAGGLFTHGGSIFTHHGDIRARAIVTKGGDINTETGCVFTGGIKLRLGGGRFYSESRGRINTLD